MPDSQECVELADGARRHGRVDTGSMPSRVLGVILRDAVDIRPEDDLQAGYEVGHEKHTLPAGARRRKQASPALARNPSAPSDATRRRQAHPVRGKGAEGRKRSRAGWRRAPVLARHLCLRLDRTGPSAVGCGARHRRQASPRAARGRLALGCLGDSAVRRARDGPFPVVIASMPTAAKPPRSRRSRKSPVATAPVNSASGGTPSQSGPITGGDSKANCVTASFPGGVLSQSVLDGITSVTGVTYNCLDTFANPMPTWSGWEAPWMFSTVCLTAGTPGSPRAPAAPGHYEHGSHSAGRF